MISATYVDYKTFTVVGNETTAFHTGRRIKAVGDSTTYGNVASSSYSTTTTVVLTEASDNLDNSLTGVYYGIVSANNSSIPEHAHDEEDTGGTVAYSDITGTPTIPTDFYSQAEVDTISGALNSSITDGDASTLSSANDYTDTEISTLSGSIVLDHGNLTGLSDDDHSQYHNDARGDTRYYQQGEVDTISGSIVEQVITDHGNLDGLGDDDHSQYSLADGSRDFTGTVGGITPVGDDDLTTKEYVDDEIDDLIKTGTDNYVARYYGTGNIQSSLANLTDEGSLSGLTSLYVTDALGVTTTNVYISEGLGGVYGEGNTNLATTDFVTSLGTALFANGYGMLGNIYNFPFTTFVEDEVYAGKGSFSTDRHGSIVSDEFIAVDPSNTYYGQCYGKLIVPGTSNNMYYGIACYDIDKVGITPRDTMKVDGSTDTYLAVTLSGGDTTMTLEDATGWYDSTIYYRRMFTWFGYQNSGGYTYPDFTYSKYNTFIYYAYCSDARLDGSWPEGGITGNTITLNKPWSGPTVVSGTAIRNMNSGGTYKYPFASNITLSEDEWTKLSGYIGGIDMSGNNVTNMFHPGTAFIKLLFLTNYGTSPYTSTMNISAVSFTEQPNLKWDTADTQNDATDYWQITNGSNRVLLNMDTVDDELTLKSDLFLGQNTYGQDLMCYGNTSNKYMLWDASGDTLSVNGSIGIGTTTPTSPLDFANTLGEKISLYNGLDYGFGIAGSLLQIYSTGASSRVGIGYGGSDSFNETLSVKGANVGIGTVSPGATLDVNGDIILEEGVAVNEFSTDTALSGNSDDAIPTEKAVKTYVDAINTDLVNDTTPQLGGDLDTNGSDILFGSGTISGTGTMVTGDHSTTSGTAEVVNVIFGTGEPPTASGVPIGTLYIQYTA